MDFFPPQSFSDLLIVWALMFVVMLGFYSLGRLIWALGLGPQATAIADKMERIQQTVMRPTGQRLIGTAAQLSKLQGWPFHNRSRR
ncbi:hypothetical protein Xgly_07430 [Xanthomonas citri pv. glycines]|uniref:Uncharacterized protein n=1 Tax=Xanthomonas campestris pv. glycines TaxID=473421 RepID=A0AAX0I1R4_XANCG|nr:hypothetical protein [Xanthomonas citri]ARV23415.1 hypothetical protein A9D66_12605 [Xanthomonas citri pv. glycines str. 12-2]OEY90732.1 hypothetical protein BIY41_12625 [Xanthomonas citri pv. glycines]OOX05612.1 hypothetical protein Xgly_07430 [Xanthomonas citri pv. glycines]QEQ73827.1 hypothetical protein C2859_13070 [Xanthomonas citri pv. glycines]QTK32924.1 hypothetical protein XcgCFBP2526_12335 [Xanthomonas citri pv. glycines CFBP 2526]